MPMQPSPMRETTAPCEPSFTFFIVITELDEPQAPADSFFFAWPYSLGAILKHAAHASNLPLPIASGGMGRWRRASFVLIYSLSKASFPAPWNPSWPPAVRALCGGSAVLTPDSPWRGAPSAGVVHHGGGFFRCDRFSI